MVQVEEELCPGEGPRHAITPVSHLKDIDSRVPH